VALGCRDCSVQRRHQKIIEEAPPPGLDPHRQWQLMDAAVRLVSRVGYVGVGTVEFLVRGGVAAFLEVNPRLQVEHGLTEELTGRTWSSCRSGSAAASGSPRSRRTKA